jgi:glutamate synthase (NADPH/NADH) small chain
VVVIGAGNTAMDCLRVARRVGAHSVRCVYRRTEAEAPARVEELRHAREEGIEFSFLHAPVEILLDDRGNVRGMRAQTHDAGRARRARSAQPGAAGEFVEWECDTVIYALGTKANPIVGQSTPGLVLDRRGYIAADERTQATSLRGVFAGGDIVTGGATVILAMAAGRAGCARPAAWLCNQRAEWPPRAEWLEQVQLPGQTPGLAAVEAAVSAS